MADFPEHFERQYQSHLKHLKHLKHLMHLKLKGLQPKTIDAYARGMRRSDAPGISSTPPQVSRNGRLSEQRRRRMPSGSDCGLAMPPR